jgi:hypothetical protein
MEESSCWALIQRGDYVGACEAADREYKRTTRVPHLRNKVLALLSLRRYDEVVALCSELMQKQPTAMGIDLIKQGVAYWLQGKVAKAIAAWRDESHTRGGGDAAGGLTAPLLLHFAAVSTDDASLRNDSIMHITSVIGTRFRPGWPEPLRPYVLGLSSAEELLAAVDTQPVLRDRQLCAAHFHIGVMHLKKDLVQTRHHMLLAVSGCPSIMLEPQYFLAKGYLEAKQGG